MSTNYIFDVSNLILRAAFARRVTAGSYDHVAVVWSLIRSIVSEGALVFAYDMPSTFRIGLWDGYKKARRDAPPKFDFDVFKAPQKLLSYLPATHIRKKRFEADDVIASYIQNHPEQRHIIVSSDRDLWALLDPPRVEVQLVSPRRLVSSSDVLKKFGVPPKKITLYKALFGDKSDGLPRVPRVFSTKLQRLLVEYETLPEIFEAAKHVDWLSEKDRTRLRDFHEQALLNLELAKLYNVEYKEAVTRARPNALGVLGTKFGSSRARLDLEHLRRHLDEPELSN